MLRILALTACLVTTGALAQSAHEHNGTASPAPNSNMHEHMGHSETMTNMKSAAVIPTQAGQSAFATIQEIVGILEADPKTDWSKVNIDALREHLIDMSNVTLAAKVKSEAIEGGRRFILSGKGDVKASIRRMMTAHAMQMNGTAGWFFSAKETDRGAMLTVTVPAADMNKLKALGFLGLMTRGMHHQQHHLMIARGDNPHH